MKAAPTVSIADNLTLKSNSWIFRASQDFALVLQLQPRQAGTIWHAHECVELVFVLDGSGRHEAGRESLRLRQGDVFAIPPGMKHRYLIEDDETLTLYNLLFDPRQLPVPQLDLGRTPFFDGLLHPDETGDAYPRLSLAPEDFTDLRPLLDELYRESNAPRTGFRTCRLGLFMVLLGKLTRLHTAEPGQPGHFDERITHVVEYLNKHYLEPIEINRLPTLAGMSRSAFLRAFSRNTGNTPLQYILGLRINRACRELLETDHSITETAFHCGFTDNNYFARIFRKLIGLSPKEFRKRSLAN